MPQNIRPITLSPERLAAVQQALTSLGGQPADTGQALRRPAYRTRQDGAPAPEAFVREGLTVLDNPRPAPRSFDLGGDAPRPSPPSTPCAAVPPPAPAHRAR